MRDPSRSATYTAIGLVVAGFIIIVLAWYGAAREDHTPAQIPYLISGGLTGLGLMGAGYTLVAVQEARRDRHTIAMKLDQILEALRAAAPAGAPASPAGNGGPGVVAGGSAYHAPGCRLLEGREGLPTIPAHVAADRGLAPCRVCTPERADEPALWGKDTAGAGGAARGGRGATRGSRGATRGKRGGPAKGR